MRGRYTEVDDIALDEFLYGVGGPVMGHVIAQAEAIKSFASDLAPVGPDDPLRERTEPHLKDTGQVDVARGVAVVRFTSGHALYVERDTRPHTITAVNAPLLVFFWPKAGRVVAFPSVNHPGTTGQPFLSHAVILAESAPLL